MEEARDTPSLESSKQKGDYSWGTKRDKKSQLCYTDAHMSPENAEF